MRQESRCFVSILLHYQNLVSISVLSCLLSWDETRVSIFESLGETLPRAHCRSHGAAVDFK